MNGGDRIVAAGSKVLLICRHGTELNSVIICSEEFNAGWAWGNSGEGDWTVALDRIGDHIAEIFTDTDIGVEVMLNECLIV